MGNRKHGGTIGDADRDGTLATLKKALARTTISSEIEQAQPAVLASARLSRSEIAPTEAGQRALAKLRKKGPKKELIKIPAA